MKFLQQRKLAGFKTLSRVWWCGLQSTTVTVKSWTLSTNRSFWEACCTYKGISSLLICAGTHLKFHRRRVSQSQHQSDNRKSLFGLTVETTSHLGLKKRKKVKCVTAVNTQWDKTECDVFKLLEGWFTKVKIPGCGGKYVVSASRWFISQWTRVLLKSDKLLFV